MNEKAPTGDFETIVRERNFYLRLLELGTRENLGSFLKEALTLVVELAKARQGYLELTDSAEGSRWFIALGFTDSEVEGIRSTISRGIIAEALATGQTIMTPSALLDPRFRDRGSVQLGRIQAVLCVPVGSDSPVGAVYLQGRDSGGPFSPDDTAKAELFARHVAPIARRLLADERRRPDPTTRFRDTLRLDGVAGRSAALSRVLEQVSLVAPLDVSVFLTGESGTGKSQIARVIHDNGPRASAPFVEVNCAALPETLIESELFGALPGAHSTAHRRIDGKIAAAERGTLFLDEVGELALPAQAKLLNMLQSKQYYPLGAAKPVSADVRVIAATNADLEGAVATHRFREDLFYRLQVLPIRVPSLAERREDIPELAAFFAAGACTRHGLPRLELSEGAIRAAQLADWPGNVRQLAHAVEAAAIRAAGARTARIERAHLFPASSTDVEATPEPVTFQEATRRFQADLLRKALEAADWNVTEVAQQLDVARSHVYNLIRAFGLGRGER